MKFKQRPSKSARQSEVGEAAAKRTSAYNVRRSQLYHNCRLLAPDGQLLLTMDRRKVEWYLERQLGSEWACTGCVYRIAGNFREVLICEVLISFFFFIESTKTKIRPRKL